MTSYMVLLSRPRGHVRAEQHVVDDLHRIAHAGAADAHDALADGFENGLGLLKGLLVRAAHNGQRALLRADGAAGNRGVHVLHAVLGGDLRHLLGGAGGDGGHINDDGAGLAVSQNALGAAHNGLDDRAVGEHGEADVHVGRDFEVVLAADGAFGDLLLDERGNKIAHVGFKARLDNVAAHMAAHAAQSDKTDFHWKNSPFTVFARCCCRIIVRFARR